MGVSGETEGRTFLSNISWFTGICPYSTRNHGLLSEHAEMRRVMSLSGVESRQATAVYSP